MELWLDNVGIVKDSSVILDGLTVITGKNNSGKTTVGKTLYAVIEANRNIEQAFENSKGDYIIAQFGRMWTTLSARRVYTTRPIKYTNKSTKTEQVLNIISHRYYMSVELDQLLTWIELIREVLPSITIKELYAFLDKTYLDIDKEREYTKTLGEQFDYRKKDAIDICIHAISMLEDPEAFTVYRRNRIMAHLNQAFHYQIKPVRALKSSARLRLRDSERTIFSLSIRSKTNFQFSNDSSYVFPFNQAIFVDNPFALDSIDVGEQYYRVSLKELERDTIGAEELSTPSEQLKKLLTRKAISSFFDDLEFYKKYRNVFEKINQIVPGEFQESNDGIYYVNNGSKLNVHNLATGSKLFSIIKLLFINGYLNKDTVLVLDEPESHLHPEWINRFAEILVLLIKEVGLNVLLTTHSPNLLLALNVYSRSLGEHSKAHFYLAKTNEDGWSSCISCIDSDISEGYAHLSIPLIEMSIQQEALSEE